MVLAPFLFTLYMSDFPYNSAQCHLEKFSDDSAVIGRIPDEEEDEYRSFIQDFSEWYRRNGLQLNTSKTKKLIVDFRRKKHDRLDW